MTAAPKGQPKSAEENEVLPVPASPFSEVPEGEVQVVQAAAKKQNADPAGQATVTRKASTKATKNDVLQDVDLSKLPIAVTVGQITVSIEEYAGRAVLSVSLVGWVGDAPLKVLASDADQITRAITELRKQLS